ncbi:hypothetical protein GJR96_07865 [Haloferax sp. MBLA0076]|uniref:Uncharacterized protein n=1 Tax=Haloferax litoreum TaxID=2666140 RepID=A0A6A8GGF6_9EURY|nr:MULTISPECIES: hypothetical protein [Haloferax]KAB1193363.1 hypothetical protein Hfx1148_07860 [Haloferax sp. CBA1148]MRX21871.1 hypothetical protein [Haloferax litoreum]
MTDLDSDEHGESRGIQIGGIHIGPLEYRFLKLVVYAVIGLFLWPYLLLLYIYIAIRRFNKGVIKVSKKASETLREEYEAGYEEGSSED